MFRLYLEIILPFLAVFIFSVAFLFTDPIFISWIITWNREWVAALSGWAAAGAAVATMVVILWQIRQSDRHHRDSLSLQKLELVNVAKKAKATLSCINVRTEPLARAYGSLPDDLFKSNYPQIRNALEDVSSWLSNDVLDEFERRIWVENANDLIGTRRYLSHVLGSLEQSINSNVFLFRRQDLDSISNALKHYCENAMNHAFEFIRNYETLRK
jgi:hypothetical protein